MYVLEVAIVTNESGVYMRNLKFTNVEEATAFVDSCRLDMDSEFVRETLDLFFDERLWAVGSVKVINDIIQN